MTKQDLEKRYEELDQQLFILYMSDKYDGKKIKEAEDELKTICQELGRKYECSIA